MKRFLPFVLFLSAAVCACEKPTRAKDAIARATAAPEVLSGEKGLPIPPKTGIPTPTPAPAEPTPSPTPQGESTPAPTPLPDETPEQAAARFVAYASNEELPSAEKKVVEMLVALTQEPSLPQAALALAQTRRIALRARHLPSLAPLRLLPKLEHLDLAGSQIEGEIGHLPQLKSLSLKGGSIPDCKSLGTLRSLERLSAEALRVKGRPLTEADCLGSLVALRSLHLGRNALSSLAFLRDLANVEVLDLSRNALSDLSSLRNLSRITDLDLSHNALADLSPVRDLTALRRLDASENRFVFKLPPLEKLRELRVLDVSGTSISDLSPLWKSRVNGAATGQFALKNLKSIDAWVDVRLSSLAGFEQLDWVERVRLNPASIPDGRCPMSFSSTCDFHAPGTTPR